MPIDSLAPLLLLLPDSVHCWFESSHSTQMTRKSDTASRVTAEPQDGSTKSHQSPLPTGGTPGTSADVIGIAHNTKYGITRFIAEIGKKHDITSTLRPAFHVAVF